MRWCRFEVEALGGVDRSERALVPSVPKPGDVVELERGAVIVNSVHVVPTEHEVAVGYAASVLCQPHEP